MNQQLDKSQFMAYAIQEIAAIDARPKLRAIIFSILTDKEYVTFAIPTRPQIIFGRSDSQASVDVDLTTFDALAKGISRKHMMLIQQGTRFLVQDLNSTNGTRIKGELLKADTFYELADKDELYLGRLKLSVTFSYEAVTSTVLTSKSVVDTSDDTNTMDNTIYVKNLGKPEP